MFDKTIVIVGPTASGKTGVAVDIAKEVGLLSERIAASETAVRGSRALSPALLRSSSHPCTSSQLTSPLWARGVEIISADSRAIYRGMDIGTAKPSIEEQQGIPHWGIDLVDPGERFTVADWKVYAEGKIREVKARGNLPIVVGGTGLYVDALVYDYSFTEEGKCEQSDRKEMSDEFIVIGIQWTPEELRARITERANKLFTQELYEETKRLVGLYNWSTQAMKSNIYQFAWAYLQGEYDLERAKELSIYDDWHLAKRQMTWFKRNKKITWLPLADVKAYVLKCIQDEQRRCPAN